MPAIPIRGFKRRCLKKGVSDLRAVVTAHRHRYEALYPLLKHLGIGYLPVRGIAAHNHLPCGRGTCRRESAKGLEQLWLKLLPALLSDIFVVSMEEIVRKLENDSEIIIAAPFLFCDLDKLLQFSPGLKGNCQDYVLQKQGLYRLFVVLSMFTFSGCLADRVHDAQYLHHG